MNEGDRNVSSAYKDIASSLEQVDQKVETKQKEMRGDDRKSVSYRIGAETQSMINDVEFLISS